MYFNFFITEVIGLTKLGQAKQKQERKNQVQTEDLERSQLSFEDKQKAKLIISKCEIKWLPFKTKQGKLT